MPVEMCTESIDDVGQTVYNIVYSYRDSASEEFTITVNCHGFEI